MVSFAECEECSEQIDCKIHEKNATDEDLFKNLQRTATVKSKNKNIA